MEGEKLAEEFVRNLGYDIRGKNIRLKRDEIDLLAFDPVDQVLVFVEVKARSKNHRDYRPELNADFRKKNAMMRAARTWIAEHNFDGGYRMDLICVANGRVVDHLKELSWD